MTAELEAVLSYENAEVVAAFVRENQIAQSDADEIFHETKRWLWMAATSANGDGLSMFQRLGVLDQMWHTFILYTEDYADFCDRYLGRFLHHRPTPRLTVALIPSQMEGGGLLLDQLAYMQLLVGDEVIRRWFLEYPRRFAAFGLPDEPTRPAALGKLRMAAARGLRLLSDRRVDAQVFEEATGDDLLHKIADVVSTNKQEKCAGGCGCGGGGGGGGPSVCKSGGSGLPPCRPGGAGFPK